jgi:hypothetical protein
MCASSSVLRAPKSPGNISRHNFFVKLFSTLFANKLRANKINFLQTACGRLLSAVMVATTYSRSPIRKSNIVPFCILFVAMSVIGLPSIFAAVRVEAGIRPSLWISQTDAGIAILAGKTFPFLPVTALLGQDCPRGSLWRLPSTQPRRKQPVLGRKQRHAGE